MGHQGRLHDVNSVLKKKADFYQFHASTPGSKADESEIEDTYTPTVMQTSSTHRC